jgi:hypothetical protein
MRTFNTDQYCRGTAYQRGGSNRYSHSPLLCVDGLASKVLGGIKSNRGWMAYGKGPTSGGSKMLRRWTPLDIRQFVESREGKIWLSRDTECLLNRLSEIDVLIQQLMQAAGITIVESAQDPHPEDLGREAPHNTHTDS